MRNINAKELKDLAQFYREKGEEKKAKQYEEEYKRLQDYYNRD